MRGMTFKLLYSLYKIFIDLTYNTTDGCLERKNLYTTDSLT